MRPRTGGHHGSHGGPGGSGASDKSDHQERWAMYDRRFVDEGHSGDGTDRRINRRRFVRPVRSDDGVDWGAELDFDEELSAYTFGASDELGGGFDAGDALWPRQREVDDDIEYGDGAA